MNNPLAFPSIFPQIGPPSNINVGMTLRDYFAAAALQGMLANEDGDRNMENKAGKAYYYADAMLAERK